MRTKVKVIRETLEGSNTADRFGLDGSKGNMERMCGEVFTVNESAADVRMRGRISLWSERAGRSFMFSMKDVRVLSDMKPPKLPKPAQFNPKLLDV